MSTPPLWSRRGADGTEYAVSAIPLGGYVKLLDEREGPIEPAQLAEAYNRKPVWARILVLLAGPFANFLFAVLAYWVLFVAGVPALKPVLGEVTADSPAALRRRVDPPRHGDVRPQRGAFPAHDFFRSSRWH